MTQAAASSWADSVSAMQHRNHLRAADPLHEPSVPEGISETQPHRHSNILTATVLTQPVLCSTATTCARPTRCTSALCLRAFLAHTASQTQQHADNDCAD